MNSSGGCSTTSPNAGKVPIPENRPWPIDPFSAPNRSTSLVERHIDSVGVRFAELIGLNPPEHMRLRRVSRTWQQFSKNLPPLRPAPVSLIGIAAVRDEGDIIFATISNLFRLGCYRVIVIDNDSQDDTAAEAIAAGAEVVQYSSDGYDESLRNRWINEVVTELEESSSGNWYIIVDGDELPIVPDGRSLTSLLATQPDDVEVLGSSVIEHLPIRQTPLPRRVSPLDFIPMAYEYRKSYCSAGHWKHQVFRVRHKRQIMISVGQHMLLDRQNAKLRFTESRLSLVMHHFPIRDLLYAQAKFERELQPGSRYWKGGDGFTLRRLQARLELVKCIKSGDLARLPDPRALNRKNGLVLTHWRQLPCEG